MPSVNEFRAYVRSLNDDQLSTAEQIFDELRDKELMPTNVADDDPNRAVRRLSAKWCAEPSVHGGKKRPAGSNLVL